MSEWRTVQEQLQEVDELISKLEGAVATDPRPSISANIRALEKARRVLQQEFLRAAQLAEMDVYRYCGRYRMSDSHAWVCAGLVLLSVVLGWSIVVGWSIEVDPLRGKQ